MLARQEIHQVTGEGQGANSEAMGTQIVVKIAVDSGSSTKPSQHKKKIF